VASHKKHGSQVQVARNNIGRLIDRSSGIAVAVEIIQSKFGTHIQLFQINSIDAVEAKHGWMLHDFCRIDFSRLMQGPSLARTVHCGKAIYARFLPSLGIHE
jgi:hypothetical protein